MKFLLLGIIRLYWILIPVERRRKCIFSKSCSNHVYEETKTKGFYNGIKELIFRVKNCQPEFDIFTDFETGKKQMRLKTGIKVNDCQISERLK